MKIDLIGQKFYHLQVVQKSEQQSKADAVLWDCICDCGTKTTATTAQLRSGHKKSCGCIKRTPKADDLTGQRFGRLTVMKRVGTADRKAIWRCRCDCGKKTDVRSSDLKSGNTKSCGCLGNHFANEIYWKEDSMTRTSSKRRDRKNRVLEKGEYQKESGVYEYRYKDIYGKTKSIYSWRLTASDPIPAGKGPCEPLRDMKVAIDKDLHNNIDTYTAQTTTLNERFDIYIESKINLRRSTKQNYIYMYDKYVRGTVGRMKMCDINYSIIQRLYNDMITKYGFKPNSMEALHTVLNPIFDRAVWDNLIESNPCPKAMKQIRESDAWVKEKKSALTLEQQQVFMRYLENSSQYRHWLNILTVLLGTGMRIGECLGLTWSECQFKTGMIIITHTLNYRKQEDGHCRHYVEFAPKTTAGIRSIPMFDEVRTALLNEKQRQEDVGTSGEVIDGLSDWVFTNRYGGVYKPKSINAAITRICNAYNTSEYEAAKKEEREPVLLSHFTCHQLRRTFCTRLCESENRPKIVQAVMGHANISTTMDVYAEVEERAKKEAIVQLQGTVFIK